MMPVIIPLQSGGIFVLHAFVVFSWCIFSFLFWRGLRRWGIDEDRIFDLVFYSTLVSFLSARTGFVIAHWDLFAGKSPLLIAALWVAPGLSYMSALIGGVATMIALSRTYKVRLGLVLDTLSTALPLPIIVALTGAVFTGAIVGIPATVANISFQHPVALYEMIALVLISGIVTRYSIHAVYRKLPYGLSGIWFFLLYSVAVFFLEFLKADPVFWGRISANQWVSVAIFAESLGVMYVRGGGKERFRPIFLKIASRVNALSVRWKKK